jgi:hypothetical protein
MIHKMKNTEKRRRETSEHDVQKNMGWDYVSKKRSSTINSWCFGEYHPTAFAEPRTCNAYSMAKTGSSTRIGHS